MESLLTHLPVGTLIACLVYRVFGTEISTRATLLSSHVATECDLVSIGNEAAVTQNSGCQTHTYFRIQGHVVLIFHPRQTRYHQTTLDLTSRNGSRHGGPAWLALIADEEGEAHCGEGVEGRLLSATSCTPAL